MMAIRYTLHLFCRSCERSQKYYTKSRRPRQDNDKKAAAAGWHAGRCPKCNADMMTDEQRLLSAERLNSGVRRSFIAARPLE